MRVLKVTHHPGDPSRDSCEVVAGPDLTVEEASRVATVRNNDPERGVNEIFQVDRDFGDASTTRMVVSQWVPPAGGEQVLRQVAPGEPDDQCFLLGWNVATSGSSQYDLLSLVVGSKELVRDPVDLGEVAANRGMLCALSLRGGDPIVFTVRKRGDANYPFVGVMTFLKMEASYMDFLKAMLP